MDVSKLLDELTLEEKCALTAGADMWTTVAIERLGIPALKLTDGPNGARGASLPFGPGHSSTCVPCGSALGATWNAALVEQVGALLGEEARSKSARVLLAPTINLHRSPLGGRNFECYSEDPLLSGQLAGAFIRGVQSRGVAATAKHFVANESESDRMTVNTVVDERALRELYLVPFETAVREGGVLAVMSAYNRVNGAYCSEHQELLRDVLKGEWGFEGFVVSDWFAAGSTVGSAEAGLDLEMPGPGRYFGPALAAAVRAGEVDEALVTEQARRLLTVLERLQAFADPLQPEPERSVDLGAHRRLLRTAAAEAMVLLRNDGVLPLEAATLTSLAVIGPNADRAHIMGGGSASLRPHYRLTPLDVLRDRLGADALVVYEPGCSIDRTAPPLTSSMLRCPSGEPGLMVDFFASDDFQGPVVYSALADDARLLYVDAPAAAVPEGAFSFRARTCFTPEASGTHTFTLTQCGRARLTINGAVVLDGIATPPPAGTAFFGMGSEEIRAELDLPAGEPIELLIEYSSQDAERMRGVQIGCSPPEPFDLIERAVLAAAAADAVVLVVGTNDDWESEGHDRDAMALPGAQDELIARVLAVNPNTVVVVNAGSPVTMPWAPNAPAVLQTWLGGQEMASALVDVLFGDAEPGGRLPTTFPIELEHNPSHGNFPGENGKIRYGEGLLVGYRWYDSRRLPVQFPFGHGLSYTSFDLGAPTLSATQITDQGVIRVEVPVTNIGSRPGSEVVQCYVHPCHSRLSRPDKELKAFAKVHLEPGASTVVALELDARAFAHWDPCDPDSHELAQRTPLAQLTSTNGRSPRLRAGWYVDAGRYELLIGTSSADISHVAYVTNTSSVRIGPS